MDILRDILDNCVLLHVLLKNRKGGVMVRRVFPSVLMVAANINLPVSVYILYSTVCIRVCVNPPPNLLIFASH